MSASTTVIVRGITGVSITGVPGTLAKGLGASATPPALLSDGATVDVTASLVSGTPSVASVTAGQLKAVNVGSAVISVSYRGVKGSASISVTAAQLVSLTTSPATVSLKRISSVQLKALATYTDGTVVDVTRNASWSSSNLLGATVCGGRVTTYFWLGKLRIVATYAGKRATTMVTVIR